MEGGATLLYQFYCKKMDADSLTKSGQIGEIVREKIPSGTGGNLLSVQS